MAGVIIQLYEKRRPFHDKAMLIHVISAYNCETISRSISSAEVPALLML